LGKIKFVKQNRYYQLLIGTAATMVTPKWRVRGVAENDNTNPSFTVRRVCGVLPRRYFSPLTPIYCLYMQGKACHDWAQNSPLQRGPPHSPREDNFLKS